MNQFEPITLTRKKVLSFAIPASLGAILFLCPISIGGKSGIVVGIVLSAASDLVVAYTPYIVTVLMVITAIFSLIGSLLKPKFITKYNILNSAFVTTPLELTIRVLGAVLAVMTLFQLGTDVIYGVDTGGTMLELCANIMVWFIVASFFVPFLLDFGLMEFVGTLVSGVARPMLRLPGRSMVNVITSFVGDQNLGIMVTNDQYVKGQYTGREAAIIAVCFSATGIAYWYIISNILNVESYFIQIVITMFLTAFIASVIMCRIWPLTAVEDKYYKDKKANLEDEKPENMSKFQFALQLAVQRALTFKGPKSMLERSVNFASGVIFAVLPVVMVVGTVGLVVATYTPVFEWLGTPFRYYLELLQVPEAAEAAPATVAGFADMLIPSLLGAEIESIRTRFIICVLSLSQIIYMSEVGPILLMSEIPIKFRHIVATFIVKTIIALPIITLMAMIFQIPL